VPLHHQGFARVEVGRAHPLRASPGWTLQSLHGYLRRGLHGADLVAAVGALHDEEGGVRLGRRPRGEPLLPPAERVPMCCRRWGNAAEGTCGRASAYGVSTLANMPRMSQQNSMVIVEGQLFGQP
jgi:hypothetical protein